MPKRHHHGRRHRRAIPNFWKHSDSVDSHKETTIRHQGQGKPEKETNTKLPANQPNQSYWSKWGKRA